MELFFEETGKPSECQESCDAGAHRDLLRSDCHRKSSRELHEHLHDGHHVLLRQAAQQGGRRCFTALIFNTSAQTSE